MRFLLRTIILAALLALLGACPAPAQAEPLRVAVPRFFPPYYLTGPDGQAKGFAIDVFERIAKAQGLDYEFVIHENWLEAMHAVREGQDDLIPNIGVIPEREQWFDFTRPVEAFKIALFVRRSTPGVDSLDDLAGRKVAVVQENKGLFLLQNRADLRLVVHATPQKALMHLLAGEEDALVYPAPVIWRMARQARVEDRIRTAGPPLQEVKRALAVNKGNEQLLAVLNRGVQDFVNTPEYGKVYATWFGAPPPFWSTSKVLWALGLAASLAVLLALLVRFRTAAKLNRELESSLQEARTTAQEREALLEATRAVLAHESFEDAARAVFDQCKGITGATAGYVALLSQTGAENEVLFLDSGGAPCSVDPGLPMPVRGLREQAYLQNQAVRDNDFMASMWQKYMPHGHMALKNVMFAPLNVEGRTVGVVGLANKDGDFNERDLRMASALADLAAMALVRDRSLELLAESERKFRQLFEQAPVALWEQDFSEVKPELDRLWAEGVRDFPAHFRGRPALGWELVRKVRILDVNQAALALYGAESKGQLLEGLSTVFSEESLDGFLHSAQSLVDGGGRLEAERAHRSLDGRRLEVQLRWAVAEGHESNWDRVLVSVTDLTPLRQAEDEQRLMSFAMDQAPDPAFIVREDGAFQYVNQAACSRLGYEREELLNMAVPDVDLEFDRQRLQELQATLRSSGSSAVKLRSRHVDRFGQEFPVEITVRHVQYQGEECDIAFATDISEQERSLELLQASETRFRELFDNMSNGVAVYRPAGDAEDFLFQDLNKAGERITGLDRADIVGRSIQDVFPAVHEFGLFETLQRVARTGSSETFDIKKYSDGRVDLWVSNAVYQLPSGEVVAVFNDEGERKRAEDELRRLAAAVEHAGETITITDRGGTILYVNPALRRLSGYSKEELIGRNPRILKSGKQSTAFYRRLWETILAGGVWRGRLVNQRKDGSLYEVDMTVSPVTSAEGEITHFVSIKRDVTEQVALERQLRESQKMEAIGALAGGIAHDFNNILMAVMGFVDLASRNLQDAGKAAAYLDYVKISSQRGADLVRQILTFSRTSETEKKPLDPAPVVKEAIRLLEATLPDNVAVTACVNDDPPRILSQPTALHQIVVNLGTNAMYAMAGAGGEMTIRLDGVDASQVDPPVPEAEADRWLLIQVSDTGAGMSEDVVQRAFEPFFTTKAPGQGAGLGLSVVHGLAKDHGGSIRIDSAPGQGAAVSVYLPACCEDADQMEPAPATDTPAGNERVLFVDDEQDLRTLVLAGLEELGYRVQTCESGDEALKLLQRDATAWDVAVTDLSMPGLGGAELAEAIRVLNPGLPVIICSGYAEATPGRGLGRPVLHKPFTPTDLARSIRDAITQRRNA